MGRFIKRIVLGLIVLGVAGVVAIGIYWWRISTYSINYGRLAISDIKNEDLLKVVQVDVDYLVDVPWKEKHYTAILPFSIQAGFNLSKIQVDTSDDKKIIIVLPPPEILNVDLERQILTIRSEESTGIDFFNVIKGFKKYGQLMAKKIALNKYHILEKAKEEGRKFFLNIFNSIPTKKKKKIEIKVPDTAPAPSYSSGTGLSEYKRIKGCGALLFLRRNSGGTLRRIAPWSGSLVGFLKKRCKCNNIGVIHNQLSLTTTNFVYTNDRCFSFFYLKRGWVYRISIYADDTEIFSEEIPNLLTLVDNLVSNLKEIIPCGNKCELFGITKAEWEGLNIKEQRDYLSSFYLFAFSCSYYKLAPSVYYNLYWRNVYLIGLDGLPPIIVDGKGYREYRKASHKFREKITTALGEAVEPYYDDKVLGILYAHGGIYRNRFLFLFRNGMIFYIPEVSGLSWFFKTSYTSKILKWIAFKNAWVEKEERSCIVDGVSKKLESAAICKFLKDFFRYGYPHLYRAESD